MDKKELQKKIDEHKKKMLEPDFWSDPKSAQACIAEIKNLRALKEGKDKMDFLPAIFTIYAGAGGDDAEDFVKILFEMYLKYFESQGWDLKILDENKNSMGGYRNISFMTKASGSYGKLKGESGVHRLVRKSPFNAKSKRQTSFCLVDVLPELQENDFTLNTDELEVSFAKSSGAGGQNVNKRETAVRIVHPKSGISVSVSSERTQERNRELALKIIKAKLYKKHKEDQEKIKKGLSVSDKVEISWGNQIRSYVFDPYQMVKDHRTGLETSKVDEVLKGNLELVWKK